MAVHSHKSSVQPPLSRVPILPVSLAREEYQVLKGQAHRCFLPYIFSLCNELCIQMVAFSVLFVCLKYSVPFSCNDQAGIQENGPFSLMGKGFLR